MSNRNGMTIDFFNHEMMSGGNPHRAYEEYRKRVSSRPSTTVELTKEESVASLQRRLNSYGSSLGIMERQRRLYIGVVPPQVDRDIETMRGRIAELRSELGRITTE